MLSNRPLSPVLLAMIGLLWLPAGLASSRIKAQLISRYLWFPSARELTDALTNMHSFFLLSLQEKEEYKEEKEVDYKKDGENKDFFLPPILASFSRETYVACCLFVTEMTYRLFKRPHTHTPINTNYSYYFFPFCPHTPVNMSVFHLFQSSDVIFAGRKPKCFSTAPYKMFLLCRYNFGQSARPPDSSWGRQSARALWVFHAG